MQSSVSPVSPLNTEELAFPRQSLEHPKAMIELMKSCGRRKDLIKARKIHTYIHEKKLHNNDIHINNALITMYAKCGAIREAKKAFDEVSDRNVVSWNALISGYAQNGMVEEALNFLKTMENENISPNSITFICILRCCKSLSIGEFIHFEARKHGLLDRDVILCTTLVDMYAKFGMMRKAQDVFDGIQVADVVAWNTLINGYAQNGLGHEALNCLRQMEGKSISPNIVTFICTLKACSVIGSLDIGEEIRAKICNLGLLGKDVILDTTLVDMYAKCGELARAQEVFDELPKRNVVTWNTLISGYIHHGLDDKALKCYKLMQDEGCSPNAVTFICILKAISRMGLLEMGEEIHAHVSERGLLQKDIVLGTTLVDMYVKCGLLDKAQNVFNGLSKRNIVTWTALITGYVQHGLVNDALDCFRKMLLEGIFPDSIILTCILKACSTIGSLQMGEEIHAEISKHDSLERDILIGTALVDMYSRCCAIERAEEVFDTLLGRNIVTWNTLIGGYAQQGPAEKALHCFRKMLEGGISPDVITFVCVLKACGNIGSIQVGQEIHSKISRMGLIEKDVVLGTSLVDMYAKCGVLKSALEVFEDLRVRNVVTWNALIAGYTQYGAGEEALKCFNKMQDEGISPDVGTFLCTLKACQIIRKVEVGEEIYGQIRKHGLLENDIAVGTALVDMYAKLGALEKAQEVFHELPLRDVSSWTALISGYVEHGFDDLALNSFKLMRNEGLSPDAVTFTCVLKACGNKGSLEIGEEIYAEVQKQGLLAKNMVLSNALLDMYVKCDSLARAQETFEALPVKNVISWTVLIMGYAQQGFGDKAMAFFQQMVNDGLSPDGVTFICILKACGSHGLVDMGREIHASATRLGLLEKDVVLSTALLDMYAKCGRFEEAQDILNKLLIRNTTTWNTLIAGYAQHGLDDEVVKLFHVMCGEGFSPDAITFILVLKSCGNIGSLEIGEEIHKEVCRREGLVQEKDIDIALRTALVDMYAKFGLLRKAQGMFNEIPVPNLASWTALMACYAQFGEAQMVSVLFRQLTVQGVLPDSVTFLVLLSAYSHRGLLDEGQIILNDMCSIYSITPTYEHYNCMVDLFGRAGCFVEAVLMIESVPCSDRLPLWSTLLGACCKWVNVDLGRWAFKQSIQLDENCAATYVCLRNILAFAAFQVESRGTLPS